MNRSRYITRHIDNTDRAIIAALTKDGRMIIRELAQHIDLSSPSITERILKLKDAGAIKAYTVLVDPGAFGLGIAAYVRMSAMPGQMGELVDLIKNTPEIVEAFHITGKDCFQAKIVVCDLQALEAVVNRFGSYASTETAIIQSTTVGQRLPKL